MAGQKIPARIASSIRHTISRASARPSSDRVLSSTFIAGVPLFTTVGVADGEVEPSMKVKRDLVVLVKGNRKMKRVKSNDLKKRTNAYLRPGIAKFREGGGPGRPQTPFHNCVYSVFHKELERVRPKKDSYTLDLGCLAV